VVVRGDGLSDAATVQATEPDTNTRQATRDRYLIMNFIRTAVRWRHGTFVLFCLLAMFGYWHSSACLRGDRPEITITTPISGLDQQKLRI